MKSPLMNKLVEGLKKTRWPIHLWKNIKDQIVGTWLIIFVTIITAWWIPSNWREDDFIRQNDPLFKYSYNEDRKTINIDTGNDFNPVSVIWMFPDIDTATSTGGIKNSFSLNYLTNSIANNLAFKHPDIVNPFNKKVEEWLWCNILPEFMNPPSDMPDALIGYPVGVETTYKIRGQQGFFRNYDLLQLRDFSNIYSSVQIYTINNVGYEFVAKKIEEGAKNMEKIINRNAYDVNGMYRDYDGTCNVKLDRVLRIPIRNQ